MPLNKRKAFRREIRISINTEIDQNVNNPKLIPNITSDRVVTTDISSLGVGIFSDYYLPVNLRLILEIDGKPFGLDNVMTIQGEVRYCMQVQDVLFKCGIRFINTAPKVKDKINEYVSQS